MLEPEFARSLQTRAYVENALDDLADGAAATYPDAAAIVRLWHNDTHQGPFLLCDQQPCHAIAHTRSRPSGGVR